ncbi:hypothetical protein D9M68_362450 [compost metagenome]
MRPFIALLALALTLPASAATIYKYTDANGNTVFTSHPPEGVNATEMEAPPAPVVGTRLPAGMPSTAEPASEAHYRVLALTNLPSEEALRANNGTFSVEVALQPRLAPGHRLQMLLDGRPYGSPSNETLFTLTNIDRGDHTLAVQVLSGSQVVQSSAAVALTVQRTSTNSPTRRPAPPPPPKPPAPAPAPKPAPPSGGIR